VVASVRFAEVLGNIGASASIRARNSDSDSVEFHWAVRATREEMMENPLAIGLDDDICCTSARVAPKEGITLENIHNSDISLVEQAYAV